MLEKAHQSASFLIRHAHRAHVYWALSCNLFFYLLTKSSHSLGSAQSPSRYSVAEAWQRCVATVEFDMGVERKRSPARDLAEGPATASSSSSALSRHTATTRSATLPPPRTSSPPASAYFSQFAADDSHVAQAAPDASSHFAYSTTLRRHQQEGPLGFTQTPHGAALSSLQELRSAVTEEGPSGLWERSVNAVKSLLPGESSDYERLPTHREETKDTPSAKFAHYSAEVRSTLMLLPA